MTLISFPFYFFHAFWREPSSFKEFHHVTETLSGRFKSQLSCTCHPLSPENPTKSPASVATNKSKSPGASIIYFLMFIYLFVYLFSALHCKWVPRVFFFIQTKQALCTDVTRKWYGMEKKRIVESMMSRIVLERYPEPLGFQLDFPGCCRWELSMTHCPKGTAEKKIQSSSNAQPGLYMFISLLIHWFMGQWKGWVCLG